MSLERWKTQIKIKVGQSPRPTFFVSDAEEINGTGGVTVRYLVVSEGDGVGLEPGVYIQTNVTPERYNGDFRLRSTIRSHVTLDLMDMSTKPPTIAGDAPFYMDYANAISFQQRTIAPNGAIVLRLNPAEQTEVEQRLKEVESGSTRMKFVPKDHVS